MMEDEHLKMAEKIVRDTRSRRSFRKTNTSTTDVGEDIMNGISVNRQSDMNDDNFLSQLFRKSWTPFITGIAFRY